MIYLFMIIWSKWVLDRTIGLSQLYFSHSLGSFKIGWSILP